MAEKREAPKKAPKRAKDHPVIISDDIIGTDEQDVGQDGVAAFEGESLIKVSQVNLEDPIQAAKMKDKHAYELFMHDDLEIEIHEVPGFEHAARFLVGVNGKQEVFTPGKVYTVKRYTVEALLRAKLTTYKAKEVTNEEGVKEYTYPSSTGLMHNFSVLRDPHPRGNDWRQAVLKQP